MSQRPPLPPFDADGATRKVRLAEDAWNSRDPDRVVGVYTDDTEWRKRAEFPRGREQVRAFLQRKWARELDYRLIKELWAFGAERIAVRFAYEWHDDSGHWYRSYGNGPRSRNLHRYRNRCQRLYNICTGRSNPTRSIGCYSNQLQ